MKSNSETWQILYQCSAKWTVQIWLSRNKVIHQNHVLVQMWLFSAVQQIPAASLQNLVEFLSSKAEGVAGVDCLT